jgi:FKBP-type peptidyl-prolyl cis-trans isomerase (trigger factor)
VRCLKAKRKNIVVDGFRDGRMPRLAYQNRLARS